MAEITVDASASLSTNTTGGLYGPIWLSQSDGYIFFVTATGHGICKKTTDSGATWTEVDSSNRPAGSGTIAAISAWFDQHTPGDTGTIIHVTFAVLNSVGSTSELRYYALDTASDTWSSPVTVASGGAPTVGSYVAITKAIGGNLYMLATSAGIVGFYRSTDDGASWASRTSPLEGVATDLVRLLPGNHADTNDIYAVFHDISANELSLKEYDDSGNSWTETSISSGVVDSTTHPMITFDAVVRHSDGHILIAAWTAVDSATADLLTWDVTNSSTITAKTNIITDSDDCIAVALFINQVSGYVFAGYLGSEDGSETALTSLSSYYKISTDGMATWGSETLYFTTQDDYRLIRAGHSVGYDGGWFMPVFFDDDDGDLFVNDSTGVNISPSVPPVVAYMALTTATALSPSASATGGGRMSGALATATALSPAMSSGSVAAQADAAVTTATATSPTASATGASLASAGASTATATCLSGTATGGATASGAVSTASATCPVATGSGASLSNASVGTATASSPVLTATGEATASAAVATASALADPASATGESLASFDTSTATAAAPIATAGVVAIANALLATGAALSPDAEGRGSAVAILAIGTTTATAPSISSFGDAIAPGETAGASASAPDADSTGSSLSSLAVALATALSDPMTVSFGAVALAAVTTATALSPATSANAGATLSMALTTATALSPVAVGGGGTTQDMETGTASALSFDADATGGGRMAGGSTTATALAYPVSVVGSEPGIANAGLSTASATSPSLSGRGASTATAALATANALSGAVEAVGDTTAGMALSVATALVFSVTASGAASALAAPGVVTARSPVTTASGAALAGGTTAQATALSFPVAPIDLATTALLATATASARAPRIFINIDIVLLSFMGTGSHIIDVKGTGSHIIASLGTGSDTLEAYGTGDHTIDGFGTGDHTIDVRGAKR